MILLTNVIFCPDMIVSISKLYTAGLWLTFGLCCKRFHSRSKVIGEVSQTNGSYPIEYHLEREGEMAEMAKMIEEPHHQMGHIALEAAKQWVIKNAIDGLELDRLSQFKICNSCK
jgi:hypothetical protein